MGWGDVRSATTAVPVAQNCTRRENPNKQPLLARMLLVLGMFVQMELEDGKLAMTVVLVAQNRLLCGRLLIAMMWLVLWMCAQTGWADVRSVTTAVLAMPLTRQRLVRRQTMQPLVAQISLAQWTCAQTGWADARSAQIVVLVTLTSLIEGKELYEAMLYIRVS